LSHFVKPDSLKLEAKFATNSSQKSDGRVNIDISIYLMEPTLPNCS